MKLLPDSIRTRAILLLLIGLTVSHIGSMVVYSADRRHTLSTAGRQVMADKLAFLAQLIDTTPGPDRASVAAAISCPGLQITWSAAEDLPAGDGDRDFSARLSQALTPYFGLPDGGRLKIAASSTALGDLSAMHLLHGMAQDRRLQVAVRLKDDSWAGFVIDQTDEAGAGSPNAILSTLVMVLATLAIAAWATRWITGPLAAFATAAERLGRDVTATPLAEDGPREVRAASRAFNRMQERINNFVEDRLQMLAAISHDLRTPITRLRLRTEQLPIDAWQQEKMLADLEEMEQMVAASLNFARDEASAESGQTIDLAALLQTICDEAADIGQDAEFDWSGRLLYQGRPQALKRLFSNLVENALRYGRRARVRAAVADGLIEVVIEDDGPGIPAADLQAVFRPFHRLEQSRNQRTGGIGLGLANARTIARAHGGDVILENRPTGGLMAVVRLPLGEEG